AVAGVEALGVEVEEGADAAFQAGDVVCEEWEAGPAAPEETALEQVADEAVAAVEEEGNGAGGVAGGGHDAAADAVARQVRLLLKQDLRLEGRERRLN